MSERLPIAPVFNRLIVKREEETAGLKYDGFEVEVRGNKVITKAGFELTGVSAKDVLGSQISKGKILAVGRTVADELQVGQMIVWGRYAGVNQEYEGVEYQVINDEDVHFIIEEG